MTISSFDLQLVPTDYDILNEELNDDLIIDPVKVFFRTNGVNLTFPTDIPDEILMDICGEIWALAQQRLNEYREEEGRDYCGF